MKIAFTGPESSGKTSLSQAVAHYFKAQWFPEHARDYLLDKNGKYDFSDIEIIALEQEKTRKENEKQGLKIYDTENSVLYIWSTFKYGKCAETIKKLLENQQFDHYFLCSPDGIPWEEDPLRESPNQRMELYELYFNQLQKQKVEFTVLKGDFDERLKMVIPIIEKKQ